MNYIFTILCLKEYLDQIFGSHYPTEIIKLITMIYYQRPKVIWGYRNCFATVYDRVYVWGKNGNEELGLGNYEQINKPRQLLLSDIHIQKIKCVTRGTFALTDSGDIYGWGSMDRSIYGIQGTKNVPCKLGFDKIKQIKSYDLHYACLLIKHDRIFILDDKIVEHKLASIKKISCGASYLIALTNDKSIYSMGMNDLGQLGLGYYEDCRHNSFEKISLENVMIVKCGRDHTVVLTSDEFYVWGDNSHGQLGLGDVNCRHTPTKLNLQSGDPVSISCGYHHTMILLKHNQMYVFGNNTFGQLGINSSEHVNILIPQKLNLNFNVKQISCFYRQTFMMSTDNNVYACGDDYDNLIKINLSDVIGIDSYYGTVAFVTKTGQIYVCGNTELKGAQMRGSLIKLEFPH